MIFIDFVEPIEALRLPLVDWRRRSPRTSSIETERSKSGGVSVPDTEWAIDLGVAGSIRSLGAAAVSAAGWREFKVFRAVLSDGGGKR